ncbi:O-antigen ligase family protein [Bacillus smithii]|uniref:O-antigen ligase family protein n=1 Tax=Bacillus smithii TaxID=1479 RepID=UPI003D22BA65
MAGFREKYQYILVMVLFVLVALFFPNSMIGLAVSLIVAALAFIRPKDGLLFLLIYFPTRAFLIEINPSLKIAGDLIAIAAFLRAVWDQRNDWKKMFQFSLFEWGFFLFILIGCVSALITGVSVGAIIFQVRAFAITYLIFYTVKRLSIEKEDIHRFLWITFTMSMILSVQGIVEKVSLRTLLMPETWVERYISPTNQQRIYGLINNPNVLAVYLTLAFICTLYLSTLVSKRTKLFLLIGSVVMMGVWILTYSRGTAIGLAVGLITYLALSRNWKTVVKALLIIVLSVIVISIPVTKATEFVQNMNVLKEKPIAAPDQQGDESHAEKRLKETFEGSTIEQSKNTGRLFIVRKGLQIFKDHPVIGSGFSTFGDSASKSYSSPIYKHYGINLNIYSDNQYIQVIAETGVLGVVGFAVFLLGMLAFLWKNRHTASPYADALISILIAVYVCGLLYNIWEDKTFTAYFYMILGGVASMAAETFGRPLRFK